MNIALYFYYFGIDSFYEQEYQGIIENNNLYSKEYLEEYIYPLVDNGTIGEYRNDRK